MQQTLLEMLDIVQKPNHLSTSGLIIVDAQREYLDGKIPLTGIETALEQIKILLDRARSLKTKIWFIRHKISTDSPIFNPSSKYFQIVDTVAPQADEVIIDKSQPNSFANTILSNELQSAKIKNLIFTGFMTHACISTSVRAASELGYRSTVVASACATRDLPDLKNNIIKADIIHKSTLCALNDLFATIAAKVSDIPD